MTTTEFDIDMMARKLAGNHRKFESFAWFDRPADSENWGIVYTHNRDSDLLDQSNGATIAKLLEPFINRGTVRPESHNHWACGWVAGFAIRVFNSKGRVTAAAKAWFDIQERLDNYPILDESDYSEREFEAALDAIKQEGRRHLVDDAPVDWAEQVYSWLSDNNQRELENRDGTGAYPSEEAVIEALEELGLLDIEE